MKEYQSQEAVKEYFDKFHKPMTTQQSTVEERFDDYFSDMDTITTLEKDVIRSYFVIELQLAEQKAREEINNLKAEISELKDEIEKYEAHLLPG